MKLKKKTKYKNHTIKVGDTTKAGGYIRMLEVVAIIEWGPNNEWVLYGYKIANEEERKRYKESWSWKKGATNNPPSFVLDIQKLEEYNDMRVCTARKWIEIVRKF